MGIILSFLSVFYSFSSFEPPSAIFCNLLVLVVFCLPAPGPKKRFAFCCVCSLSLSVCLVFPARPLLFPEWFYARGVSIA